MALAVVNYPALEKKDLDWIQEVREGHDALFFEVIAPHIPIVFPTDAHRWLSATFPARDEGYFIGPYIAHYADELLRDLGLRTRRLRNPVAEHLAPFWPSRYEGLAEERREGGEREEPKIREGAQG